MKRVSLFFSSLFSHNHRTIQWVPIIVLGFLLVFIIPNAAAALALQKQLLLILGASVGLMIFLIQSLHHKKLILSYHKLLLIPAAFFIVSLLSAATSLSPRTSFIGGGSQEHTSLLTLGCLIILGYLLTQKKDPKRHHYIHYTLLFSGLVTVVLFLAETLGITSFGLTGLNSVGTINALAIVLIAISAFGESQMISEALPKWQQVATRLFTVATFIILLVIDYHLLWLLLGLITLILVIRAIKTKKSQLVYTPITLTVLSLLFFFISSPLSGSLPTEISPSFSASSDIAIKTIESSSYLLGSGQGTFIFDYIQFKDPAINATSFWEIPFDRSASYAYTLLATQGVLGFGVFFLWMIALIFLLLRHRANTVMQSYGSMWLVIGAGLIVYSANTVLLGLFWMLSFLILGELIQSSWSIHLKQTLENNIAKALVVILVSVGIISLILSTSERFVSTSLVEQAASQTVEESIISLDRAASLTPSSDTVHRHLAVQYLILGSAHILNEQDPQETVTHSVQSIKRATELSPHNVANWQTSGLIYSSLIGSAENAAAFAIDSYQRAHELDPTNPAYLTELGKLYLYTHTQSAHEPNTQSVHLVAAEEHLEQATLLKPDYAPAHFYLALAYETQGELQSAIDRMTELQSVFPQDVGVAFQLGLLYLRQGKLEQAELQFLYSIQLEPNFVNAYWYLGALYEKTGNLDRAKEMIEIVVGLVPENELAQAKLISITDGITATQIPEPVE